jgi:sortase A
MVVALCFLIVGLWQIGEGSWIYAKARLAQYLLQRAWSRTLTGEAEAKPWPWADTWPVARLMAPSKHIDLIILNGSYGRTLAFGPGYAESSSHPGLLGTSILTGHRDTHFAFMKNVRPGERLLLQTTDGSLQHYRITNRRIIDSRTGTITLGQERRSLVLVTCYPFDTPIPGGPLRYVVTADEENGERDARVHD